MGIFSREPDPIDHSTTSSLATAGWETAKGSLAGFLVSVGLGAAIVGGIAFAFSASATVLTVAAIGGAFVGGSMGTIPALIGAVVGLFRGGSRISAENEAYREHVEDHMQSRGQKMQVSLNNERIAGMQEGYAVGVQDAETRIAQQLQMAAAAQAQTPAAKEHCPVVGDKTKALAQERAAAGAAPQVGA